MSYATDAINRETILAIKPVDGRKSFYGKAHVHVDEKGNELLTSYGSIVAEYDRATNKVRVKGWYSTTTMRHINSFLARHGKPTMGKAELEKAIGKATRETGSWDAEV